MDFEAIYLDDDGELRPEDELLESAGHIAAQGREAGFDAAHVAEARRILATA